MADSENESKDREESELIGRNKVLLQIAQKEGICAGRDRKHHTECPSLTALSGFFTYAEIYRASQRHYFIRSRDKCQLSFL